jgi:hypothetical protein
VIDVYAVLERPPRRDFRDDSVRFVKVGALAVACGDTERAPELSEATLRARDRLVRELAASCDAILPARFGSLVADEAELAEKLAPLSAELAKALDLVRGREQMTLRVFGSAVVAAPTRATTGTEYLAERARAATAARSVAEIAPLRARLAPLVFAERVERHEGIALRATVHHLVARGGSAAYLAAIPGTVEGFTLRASGPQPPYAFAPGVPA